MRAEKLSLSTDSWTALTTKSYVTVTCQNIDNWEPEWRTLQARAMQVQCTAENIYANMLSTVTQLWGFDGKATACVHDNDSNMMLASTDRQGGDSKSCFAH